MSLVKSRWLTIKTDYNTSEIFKCISLNEYTQESKAGFIDVINIEETIEATFVEEITLTQYILDPYGNETEQQVNSFNHIDFRFIENKYIEIFQPPRSIKNLTQFLSKIFNHNLFIGNFKIDINKALDKAKNYSDSLHLKKVRVSGLKIGEKGLATVEVKSSQDALKDLHVLSKKSNYKLDKVSGTISIDRDKFDFEISNQGQLSYDEDFHDKFIDIFIMNDFIKE